MKIFFKLMLVFLISPSLSQGAIVNWGNPSGGLFNTPGNWIGGTAPSATVDQTVFDLSAASPYTVTFGGNAINTKLFVRNDDLIFDLGGNTYRLNNDNIIGQDSGVVGRLRITNGILSGRTGYIGFNPGSTGFVTVAGAGSQWNNSSGPFVGTFTVGSLGDGTLNIEAGGLVTNRFGIIGSQAGSMGFVTVTGVGSQWNNSSSLSVGQTGDGTLDIEAGGVVTNISGIIGRFGGSTGFVTVTGTGSEWNNSDLFVGGVGVAGGKGILTIEAGGTVNVAGVTEVWGSTDTVINLAGGTLKTATLDLGGDPSRLNWTAGALYLTGAVGANAGTFTQGADVILSQDVAVGASYAGLIPDLAASLSGAIFLAGQNLGTEETVSAQWTEASSNGQFGSDILNITGMQLDGGAASQTDPFALQMNYDLSSFGITEADLILSGDLALFWDNGANWVNAVDGNFANNATGGQLGFAGSFVDFQTANGTVLGDYLGAWGYDTANASVWAVLDHNSSFAAVVPVPEPSAYAMLLLAGMVGLACWRKKQNKALLGKK